MDNTLDYKTGVSSPYDLVVGATLNPSSLTQLSFSGSEADPCGRLYATEMPNLA